MKSVSAPGTYVEVARTWRTGDLVELALPKALRLEPLPDNPSRVAIMWGPLVLAGDLGPVPPRSGRGSGAAAQTPPLAPPPAPLTVPVLVTPERSVSKWLTPVAARPGVFTTAGIGRDRDVEFVPFSRLHHRVYGAYWDLLTPDQWQARSKAIHAAQESQRKLEAATIAFAQPGQLQTERDFNQQGENSTPVQFEGRYGRRSTIWFSYDLAVDPAQPMILVVTCNRDERQRRTFEILVDGTKVGEQVIERRSPEKKTGYFDVEYRVPAEVIQGKQKVTVRFQGTGGSEVAAVYGIRMIRGS